MTGLAMSVKEREVNVKWWSGGVKQWNLRAANQ